MVEARKKVRLGGRRCRVHTSSAKAAPEEQRRAAARAIRETFGCALNIVFPLDRLNLMRHRIGLPMPLLWRSGYFGKNRPRVLARLHSIWLLLPMIK
jgi:hypothetical protein